MYCIKCGVKLADTEKKCPLCHTIVCHPDFEQTAEHPFYPENKMPKSSSGSKALIGIFMLLIEYLLSITFALNFIGWSIYPLVVLALLGGLLIYLGINDDAREVLERKFFI